MIGDFIGADQDLVMVILDRFIESFPVFVRQGHGTGGNEVQDSLVQEPQGGILHDFRIHVQMVEATVGQPSEDGIAYGTYSGLQGPRIFRQSAMLDFILQEIHDVFCNLGSGRSHGFEGLGFIGFVGKDHGGDFLQRTGDIGRPDPVLGVGDRDDPGSWSHSNFEDIMHAHEPQGKALVDFHDDFVCIADCCIGRPPGSP